MMIDLDTINGFLNRLGFALTIYVRVKSKGGYWIEFKLARIGKTVPLTYLVETPKNIGIL